MLGAVASFLVAVATGFGAIIGPEVRWALWGLLFFVGIPATVRGIRTGLRLTPGQQAVLTVLFLAQLVNFGVSWAEGLPHGSVRLQAGQLMLAFAVAWVVLADRRGG